MQRKSCVTIFLSCLEYVRNHQQQNSSRHYTLGLHYTFDIVVHQTQFRKMKNLGIHEIVLRCVISGCSGYMHRVTIKGPPSNRLFVISCAPQESILNLFF